MSNIKKTEIVQLIKHFHPEKIMLFKKLLLVQNVCIIATQAILCLIPWRHSICVYFIDIRSSL